MLGFVYSQRSTHLVFWGKANQLKASEVRGRWENMHVLRVVFDCAGFASHREHVSFTYFVFVTFTWLSIVHSSKTFFYVSLYSEEERRFGKSGNLCTQRSELASQTCGKTSMKKQGTSLFFNPFTDRYRSTTTSSRLGAAWCVWGRGSWGRCESSIQRNVRWLPHSSKREEKAK